MVPETAVFFMRKIKEAFEEGHLNTEAEALQMGIDALRQPEIIRCKDCAKHEYCRVSTVWAVAPGDDWYCADAERRTDETQNT